MSCKVIEKNLDFYSSNSIFCSPQDNLEEIIEDRKLAQKVMFQKTSDQIVKRSQKRCYCIGKLKWACVQPMTDLRADPSRKPVLISFSKKNFMSAISPSCVDVINNIGGEIASGMLFSFPCQSVSHSWQFLAQNVILDILEAWTPYFFRKYSICWVFQASCLQVDMCDDYLAIQFYSYRILWAFWVCWSRIF